MPITKAAKKAVKKNITRRKANVRDLNLLKKTKKDFLKLVKEGKMEEAKKMAPNLYKTLDKAAKTNLIKKNKADRDKSRLMKKLKVTKK